MYKHFYIYYKAGIKAFGNVVVHTDIMPSHSEIINKVIIASGNDPYVHPKNIAIVNIMKFTDEEWELFMSEEKGG